MLPRRTSDDSEGGGRAAFVEAQNRGEVGDSDDGSPILPTLARGATTTPRGDGEIRRLSAREADNARDGA